MFLFNETLVTEIGVGVTVVLVGVTVVVGVDEEDSEVGVAVVESDVVVGVSLDSEVGETDVGSTDVGAVVGTPEVSEITDVGDEILLAGLETDKSQDVKDSKTAVVTIARKLFFIISLLTIVILLY